MTGQEFSEFVKRKAAQAETDETVDWDRRRDEWLRELDTLYKAMTKHLKPYTNEIKVERVHTKLSEDYLGTYEAEMLTFKIGREKVTAKPIGTLLIGARGRVDLSGPRKTLRIVLLDRNEPESASFEGVADLAEKSSRPITRREIDESGWYIAAQPPSKLVVPFCEDSFCQSIMEVTGE